MRLSLRPMSEAEFEDFRALALDHYAEEKERAECLTPEEARKVAEDSFSTLLPQGIKTEGHFLFKILGDPVAEILGDLWYGFRGPAHRRVAYLYDISLKESARGRGFGRQVMLLLEDEVRKQGLGQIGLHVFGHNARARKLYESLGFVTTNVVMAKSLK